MKKYTMNEARTRAQRLIEKGHFQKVAAKEVGVSQKTMGVWVKKYGWEEKREVTPSVALQNATVKDFLLYIQTHDAEMFRRITKMFGEYIITDNGIPNMNPVNAKKAKP